VLDGIDGVLGQVHGSTGVMKVLNVESEDAIDIAVPVDFESLIIAEGFEECECLGVFGVRGWCQCLSHEPDVGWVSAIGVAAAAAAHLGMSVFEQEGPDRGSVRAHPQD